MFALHRAPRRDALVREQADDPSQIPAIGFQGQWRKAFFYGQELEKVSDVVFHDGV
jgi:hypothetical protein